MTTDQRIAELESQLADTERILCITRKHKGEIMTLFARTNERLRTSQEREKIEGLPEGYTLKGFYRRVTQSAGTPYLGETGDVWRVMPDDPFIDDVLAVLIPIEGKS